MSDDGMAAASGYGFLVERGMSRRMRFLLEESEERGRYQIEAEENEVGDRIGLGHRRIGLREGRVFYRDRGLCPCLLFSDEAPLSMSCDEALMKTARVVSALVEQGTNKPSSQASPAFSCTPT